MTKRGDTDMDTRRNLLKKKRRVVIKIGSSSLQHTETGDMDYIRLEVLVRELCNLKNQGKDVVLVSSGAIAQGKKAVHLTPEQLQEHPIAVKQACAAVGQGKLMMIYEKLFNEYGQLTAQVLLTKESVTNAKCRKNAKQTFDELFKMQVVPIVNENDAISVDELSYGNFGDNDTLAAYVSRLVDADLLILMSDIDGLYTDDPRKNPNARFIHTVGKIGRGLENMAKGASSDCGTGGMATKIKAAKIATAAGADMIIANGDNIYSINDVMNGKKVGTLFLSEQHQKEMAEEVAPERAEFRRQAKREKKV